MSFLTRVRFAIVQWWIRNAGDRRRLQAFDDAEGMGRRLTCRPLSPAHEDRAASALPPAVPVAKETVHMGVDIRCEV
jgi:hypothetical protein